MSTMSLAKLTTIVAVFSAVSISGVRGSCYFPAAFQGEYVTQSIMSGVPTISYSSLSVLTDSIPVWGVCHRRIGNNVIMMEDTGGITCFKCFNLVLRSSNVLQVHTGGLDKCYTTEERAIADCPTDIAIREKRAREIMLYRTKGFMGEPAVSPTYCPINGAYSFTYSVNDGTENMSECSSHTSEIADCPYGFGFNLNFRGCSFGNLDKSFHCLGDWEGPDGQRYVALMDTQATSRYGVGDGGNGGDGGERPRYRCALYEEDVESGHIRMALSSDSTCINQLRSPTDGYETMRLRPKFPPAWPSHLRYPAVAGRGGGECDFPEWMQGKWEHVHVDGGTMLLKDTRNFKTYTAKCVGQGSEMAHMEDRERFLVYARTQCGDEHYKCVWLKDRGDNALEMQIGLYTSPTHNESLCEVENFLDRTWVTQGRQDVTETTPYPIVGEYSGVIPDTDGLCAKAYSDCNNPEIMFYTIFNCFNRSEVYEEREYRCLGTWTEDGLVYTYTERRDMIGYECFVGLITAKGDIYLREAGNNCERGQEPLKYGMRLSQVSKCYGQRNGHRGGHAGLHHHRWRTTTRRPRRKHVTALPSWRSNVVDSAAVAVGSAASLAVAASAILLCLR